MGRLTERGTRKNGYVSAIGSGLGCWEQIIDRLAAYEDTGLEPQEIMALIAPSPNTPLTLEELREMDGEPVWLHTFSSVKKKTNVAQWAIVETVGNANATFLRVGINSRLTKWFANYGNTWLAYRCKPEEGT